MCHYTSGKEAVRYVLRGEKVKGVSAHTVVSSDEVVWKGEIEKLSTQTICRSHNAKSCLILE